MLESASWTIPSLGSRKSHTCLVVDAQSEVFDVRAVGIASSTGQPQVSSQAVVGSLDVEGFVTRARLQSISSITRSSIVSLARDERRGCSRSNDQSPAKELLEIGHVSNREGKDGIEEEWSNPASSMFADDPLPFKVCHLTVPACNSSSRAMPSAAEFWVR